MLVPRYAVIVEKTGNGCGAYVPDLPGYIAARRTGQEATALSRTAVGYHLQMLPERGDPVPKPRPAPAASVHRPGGF